MRRRTLRLSRRRLLAGLGSLLAAGAAGLPRALPTFAAEQTLPPDVVEATDGAFFPREPGSAEGFYVRNADGGPHFWTLYDNAGGHAWYGRPLSRVWEDSGYWYQLFDRALFRQATAGGEPELAPLVDLLVTGPPVSSDFSNITQLEFDGWPQYQAAGGAVDPTIGAFLADHPGLTAGPSRSELRDLGSVRRQLFQNCGIEYHGYQTLGALGQRYKAYFAGTGERLPASALDYEQFELIDTAGGIADNLAGTVAGPDTGFGGVLASELGIVGGTARMDALGLSWSREQFLWYALDSNDPARYPEIATDRNFRTTKQIIGLLQFTPGYAGGGLGDPQKFNPPWGPYHAWDDPLNTWGQFVYGIVSSRRPVAEFDAAVRFDNSAVRLNPISRWIPWNEPDICMSWMEGYAWGGTQEEFFRLVQVAYEAMIAADPNAELIYPTLGLVDVECDSGSGTQFFEHWLDWLAAQPDKEFLVAHNCFFHHISLALHKEPERVCEFVARYRAFLAALGDRLGVLDPLVGLRKIIVMETGLQDDPGQGAFFTDEHRAHFIIQSIANALYAGADEIALFKLVDYPPTAPAGQGAQAAVRFMSHVTRQHPDRRKTPAIWGPAVYGYGYRRLFRIDLPGKGFVTTVIYNRAFGPRTLDLSFEPTGPYAPEGGPIVTSDHLGNETQLELGAYSFDFEQPHTHTAPWGTEYAWVGGGTRLFRYPDTVRMLTPSIY